MTARAAVEGGQGGEARAVAGGRPYIAPARRSDWRTPERIVGLVTLFFGAPPGLDPCASDDPANWFATVNYHRELDGLGLDWLSRTVYVNPPFDGLKDWAAKCASEHSAHGCEVVLLMPARTDTRAWHEHVATATAICLIRGRLTFVGAPAPAPFPCALVYWGSRPWHFHRHFGALGMVLSLGRSPLAREG